MPPSSKDLVRALFAGKPIARPPFIPYVASAAAQYMQVPLGKFLSDATALANSLQSCQRLFRYDGVVILFDDTVEAEALGCKLSWPDGQMPRVASPLVADGSAIQHLDASGIERKGRIPVVLEAARRLTQTVGRDAAVLGVVTGPVTLGCHLMGDSFLPALASNTEMSQKAIAFAGKVALALARACGEIKLDGFVLADRQLASLAPDRYPVIQPALKTLRNLLSFYDMPLIVQTGRVTARDLPAFFQLEADGFSPASPVSAIIGTPASAGRLSGAALPESALLGPAQEVERATAELVASARTARLFITTEGPVPQATPALNLHSVMRVLRSPA